MLCPLSYVVAGVSMSRHIRKIAFVLPNFQAGGAERVMLTVASNLNRSRFEPVIIVFDDKGPLKEIIASDIQIVSLKSRRVGWGIFKFISAVRKRRPDIVISTMAHLNIAVLLAKPFLPKTSIIVREAVTPSYFSDYFIKNCPSIKMLIYSDSANWIKKVGYQLESELISSLIFPIHFLLPQKTTQEARKRKPQ